MGHAGAGLALQLDQRHSYFIKHYSLGAC
jgi:hypothetical protein